MQHYNIVVGMGFSAVPSIFDVYINFLMFYSELKTTDQDINESQQINRFVDTRVFFFLFLNAS